MSKGSRQRPTNKQSFDSNFDMIFNKKGHKPMNPMPCSITDDPYCDASDHYENKGVYKSEQLHDEDDEYDSNVHQNKYKQ